MLDISDLTETAGRDRLVVIFGLFVLGRLATFFIFKTRRLGPAIVRVAFPILLTIAFVRAGIVPCEPLQSTGTPFRDAAHGALKVAWWLWAAWGSSSASCAPSLWSSVDHAKASCCKTSLSG